MSEEIMNSDSFFGKNGTIQKTTDVANAIQKNASMNNSGKSSNALGGLVSLIMSFIRK